MDKTAKDGARYVLMVVDVFSGMTRTYTLARKDAASVAAKLHECFCEMGFPKIVSSDNGPEFINQGLEDMARVMGYSHQVSAAYNPRAQGKVERRGGETALILNKLRHELGRDWLDVLPTATYILNTRIDPVTGYSPFEIVYHREPPPFQDYAEATSTYDAPTWHQRVRTCWQVLLPFLQQHRRAAAERHREECNKRRRLAPFWKEGQKVMIMHKRKHKGEPRFAGPYTVAGRDERNNYQLIDRRGAKLQRVVPHDQTKPAGETVDTDIYDVDRILDTRYQGKNRQYRVRWADYDATHDTWEPEANIFQKGLLDEFWCARRLFPRVSDPVARAREQENTDDMDAE